jgi:hypothetical protein
MPFEVTGRGRPDRAAPGDGGSTGRIVQRIDSAAVRVHPTLFGYQFLYQLVPDQRPRR